MQCSPIRQTLLLVVDLQQGFDEPRWGRRNNPHLEQRASELLRAGARPGARSCMCGTCRPIRARPFDPVSLGMRSSPRRLPSRARR